MIELSEPSTLFFWNWNSMLDFWRFWMVGYFNSTRIFTLFNVRHYCSPCGLTVKHGTRDCRAKPGVPLEPQILRAFGRRCSASGGFAPAKRPPLHVHPDSRTCASIELPAKSLLHHLLRVRLVLIE